MTQSPMQGGTRRVATRIFLCLTHHPTQSRHPSRFSFSLRDYISIMVATRRQRQEDPGIPGDQPPPASSNQSANNGHDAPPPQSPNNMPPQSPAGSNANQPPHSMPRSGNQGAEQHASVPPSSHRSRLGSNGPPRSANGDEGRPANDNEERPANGDNDGGVDNGNNPPPPQPSPPPSLSLSEATFAGPGQRGRQLMSLADPLDRFGYLTALETINETFARQLRSRGVEIPRRESPISSSTYLFSSQSVL